MTEKPIQILLVEDEEAHAELVRHYFKPYAGRYSLTVANTLCKARESLEESQPDLVIADLCLPDGRAIDLLPAGEQEHCFPVVVITSHGDEQAAIEAMKAGALEYAVKSAESFADMPHIAARALREWKNKTELKTAQDQRETISFISHAFLTSKSLESFYQEIPKILSSRFKFPIAAIELYDKPAEEMVFVGSVGLPTSSGGVMRVPVDQTISGAVARTGKAVLELKAGERSEYRFAVLRKLGVETFLCVPMKIDKRVLGTLALADPKERQIPQSLCTTLQVIANYLAQAAERKQAEEKLRESEEKFKELAESISDVFFAMDRDLKYTYWNKASEKLVGISAKEALGKSLYDLFPDTKGTKLAKLYLDTIKKQKPHSMEYPYRLRARDYIFEINAYPTKDGLSAFTKDITERKRAEEVQQARHLRIQQQQAATVKLAINKYVAKGELKKAVRMITEVSAKVMGVERVSFWMFSEDRKELRCVDLFERTPNKHSKDMVLYCKDYPRYFDALEKGRAVVAHDARRDSTTSEAGDSYLVPLGITSLLDAAVRISGKVVGVVCHEHVGEQRTWQVDEINFSGEVADHVANTLMNAERKQAEKALLESEERFRTSVDNMLDCFGIYSAIRDQSGRIIDFQIEYVNEAACLNNRITREEQVGKRLCELLPAHRETGLFDEYCHLVETGEPVIKESLIFKDVYHQDILTKAFDVRAVKFKDGFAAAWRDVTERKQAEEKLRESESRYRLLAENVKDIIWIMDLGLCFTYVSPSVERVLGYRAEDAISKKVGKILPPESYKLIREVLEEELAKENIQPNDPLRSRTLECELYCKDRSTLWCETKATFLRDKDGRPVGILGVARNITERKRAEEALRESEEKYRNLVERANDGILINQEGIVRFANTRIAELLGYTVEEIINTSFLDYVYPDERPRIMDIYKKRLQGKDVPNIYEMLALHKDGRKIEIETNSGMITYEGKPALLALVRDITERKQAEEELKKANEELHRLSTHLETVREKERTFLAREIHDEFGQLLTALKMELSWIGSKLPEEHKALIGKTKSMTQLIDKGIKTVQKISSRLRMGLLDDLGLKEALEREIQEFERKTPGIKCETDLNFEDIVTEKELSTTVFRILQEALTNISRHAKATLVKVKLKKENDRLVLKIRDNGIGITKDKIFHKYSFGLLGIRERAFHLGGEVNISGRRNKGTTITVTIPLDKKVDSQ